MLAGRQPFEPLRGLVSATARRACRSRGGGVPGRTVEFSGRSPRGGEE
jgi:hypothetical protein